jgi:hypothetical protein
LELPFWSLRSDEIRGTESQSRNPPVDLDTASSKTPIEDNLISSQAIAFLSELNVNPAHSKHILLLLEEPEAARLFEYRFLRDGLENGCSCVYLVSGPEERLLVEEELADFGVDVEHHSKNNRLKVLDVREIMTKYPNENDEDSRRYASRILRTLYEDILGGMKSPIRGVGIVASIDNLSEGSGSSDKEFMKTTDGKRVNFSIPENHPMEFQLGLEEAGNIFTKDIQTSWICPYFVKDIQSALDDNRWIPKLISYHEAVVYVRRNANTLALNLS